MENKNQLKTDLNNYKSSNFWFGFALGGITIATIIFFLGTKKGRQALKNLLDISENLEENLLFLLEELEKKLEEKEEEINKIITKKSKNYDLTHLLNKMKNYVPQAKKQVKKFFIKEGKIVEKSS